MNLIARDNVVAVVFQEREVNQTASGLLIAGSAKKPQFATVVAVGPGERTANGDLIPIDIQVGDQVFVGEYDSQGTIKDGDTEIQLFRSHCIMAIVPTEAADDQV
jgi:chaperonin GroES